MNNRKIGKSLLKIKNRKDKNIRCIKNIHFIDDLNLRRFNFSRAILLDKIIDKSDVQ